MRSRLGRIANESMDSKINNKLQFDTGTGTNPIDAQRIEKAEEEIERLNQQNADLKKQIEALNAMNAKIINVNETNREMLKLVLKGALDGNITEEDCERLGMTEDEIRSYIKKIKEGAIDDGKALKKIEDNLIALNKMENDNEKAEMQKTIFEL